MKKCWIYMLLCLAVLTCMAVPARAESYDALRQQMKESFQTNTMLDVSEYELTPEQLQEIYDELYHSGQLPWYADEDCDFTYSGIHVAKFIPKVLSPRAYDRDLYEQKIAELMGATCLPGMTDWQKAVLVHDYIILHTAYDEELLKNTGYDCLVNGTTACYGYAMLYMDVMNRQGIPCQIVVSHDTGDGYGHAWNVVQLDGQWYHVDLTWDDPLPDTAGFVSHDHLLKTDAEFQSSPEPHDFEWDVLVETAEEPFEADDFLEGIYSGLCVADADHAVYRMETWDQNLLISRQLSTGHEIIVHKFDYQELDLGDGSYLYSTYGLCCWNCRVYFNREDRVLSMLPNGKDVQEVYVLENEDRYIMGCMVEDGVLQLTIADYQLETEDLAVQLENVEFHTHSYHRYTQKATCQAEGYFEQRCECGVAYNREVIPQLEHRMETVEERAPTQEENGVVSYKCAHCEYAEYTYLPKLPAPEKEANPLLWLPAGVVVVLLLVAAAFVHRKRRTPAA